MIENLKAKNAGLTVIEPSDALFAGYGRAFDGVCLKQIIDDANTLEIGESVSYQPANPLLERDADKLLEIERGLYGEMPAQIGICWGKNSMLDGLEWHRGSELIAAATDIVLLLAKYSDFEENFKIDTEKVIAVYVKAGSAVELYPFTLHLAPCQVADSGFRAVIILPRGTNEELNAPAADKYLLKKNKWIVNHPDANPENATLYGKNIQLFY